MSEYYRDKLIWIAGATQGIGRDVSFQLAASGARLVLLARTMDDLVDFRDTPPLAQSQTEICQLDLTRWKDVKEAVTRQIQLHGTPDAVFNFVGLARAEYLDKSDLELHRVQMNTNYFGTLHLTRAVLPYLLEQGHGQLVHTSSLAGLIGLFGYTGYCASKFAVTGFTESLRRELHGTGVSVSLLCPPNVQTPGFDKENEQKPDCLLKMEETVPRLQSAQVARVLLQKCPSKPPLIIPSSSGWLAYYLSKFAPWVIDLWSNALKRRS